MYSVPNMPDSVIVPRPKLLSPRVSCSYYFQFRQFRLEKANCPSSRPPTSSSEGPAEQMAAARLLVVVAAAVALCGVAVLTLGSVREHNVAETGERVSKSSIESAVVLCSVR